jgi:hypothetical protein
MDQAVNTLSELAKATTEVGDKVEVLRTLAQAYTRSEKYDQAIETLKQIPQLIDYHKAVQMKDYYTEGDPEDVLTGRQPNMMFQFPMMGGMGMGPQPQRGGPGGEMPPPPPGERRPDQPREGAPARDPGATRDAAPANPAPLRQEPANPHHNQ